MKTRMTVKWIHRHVTVAPNELPGSVHGIRFSQTLADAINEKDWQTENYNDRIETRVYKRLEKLGYIINNGMYQLTVLGYKSLA
jgi:hypothetical protein